MTLINFLELIKDPDLREKVLAFHHKHLEAIKKMPASVKHHHKCMGGYYLHLTEMANNALTLFGSLAFASGKEVHIDDLVMAVYFHDIDKLFYRYQLCEEPPTPKQIPFAESLGLQVRPYDNKQSISARIDHMKEWGEDMDESDVPYFEYQDRDYGFAEGAIQALIAAQEGIIFNLEVMHAISFAHGGWTPGIRPHDDMSPLATLLHCADMLSCKCQNGKLTQEQKAAVWP